MFRFVRVPLYTTSLLIYQLHHSRAPVGHMNRCRILDCLHESQNISKSLRLETLQNTKVPNAQPYAETLLSRSQKKGMLLRMGFLAGLGQDGR